MSLISQTAWHGNPRPVLSYYIVEWDDVSQRYGSPLYVSYVSDLPFDEIGTVSSVTLTDPQTITCAGQFLAGQVVDITWTGDVTGAGGGQWVFKQDTSPEGAAYELAEYLKGADGLTTAVDGRVCTVGPLDPNTTLTINTITLT